jgi:hypothetical protein
MGATEPIDQGYRGGVWFYRALAILSLPLISAMGTQSMAVGLMFAGVLLSFAVISALLLWRTRVRATQLWISILLLAAASAALPVAIFVRWLAGDL